MQHGNYILSIAGLDPSGGAGILADIQTINAHKANGMAVCTALTFQNDLSFKGLSWISFEEIIHQIDSLIERFEISYVKIGLIKNYEELNVLLSYLRSKLKTETFILWDPILKASAGYNFHHTPDTALLLSIASKLNLITPNTEEMGILIPKTPVLSAAQTLSQHCPVLLKGGHWNAEHSNDYLYTKGKETVFTSKRLNTEKRGTGCVLSSGIVSQLSMGFTLEDSVLKAKQYVEQYLVSSDSKIGLHHV